MAFLEFNNIKIKSIAACVPKTIARSVDSPLFTKEEAEKFAVSTGIVEKRVCATEVTTSDLCFTAASQILDDLSINRDSIDALIFISQTPDYCPLPATGIILQDRLGLPKSTMAFDIGLGCSGYVVGLSIASSLLQAPTMTRILLLVGEANSKINSREDRVTYPLLGDAGTATLIERSEIPNRISFNVMSDGSGWNHLHVKSGGTRHPITQESIIPLKRPDGNVRADNQVFMDGLEIFNFSITAVTPSIKMLLKQSGIDFQTIDYFIFHQANRMMLEIIRKQLKILPEKFPYSLTHYANTSSASIPLTIVSQLRQDVPFSGRLLMSGFGVGLSWANCVVDVNSLVLLPIKEL